MKKFKGILCIGIMMLLLSGCGAIGAKSASLSIVYAVTCIMAFAMLVCYCSVVQKKDVWCLLLFVSILIINSGYLALALSKNLEEALLANRIAYLGSVFLPMAMLMIIINATRLRYWRWAPGVLLTLAVIAFLVAASPGYSDIYYKSVSFGIVDGVGTLEKVYGPWHSVYLFYLLGYFVVMIAVTVHAFVKKKMDSTIHMVMLAVTAFINIGVWLIEQLVKIDFEMLAVSYIISEVFLLGLNMIQMENERLKASLEIAELHEHASEKKKCEGLEKHIEGTQLRPLSWEDEPAFSDEQLELFQKGVKELTPTEHIIYEAYTAGFTTKGIMAELNIKENTLKFHNKNIYSKLGVSSRKQLLEIYNVLRKQDV